MATPQEQLEARVSGKKKLRPDGSEYSKDPKIRHQELVADGKLGAKGSELARQNGAKGGRPRKVSAQQLVAEKARDEAEEIWEALRAGIDSDSTKEKRESAKEILAWEERHMRRQEREQERREGLDKDKLIGMLVERLTGDTAAARMLRKRLDEQNIVDADVIEDQPALTAGSN